MATTAKATQGRKRLAKACANPMFEKWLEEWKQEAQERGLNSVHTYRKVRGLALFRIVARNSKKNLYNFTLVL